MVSDAVLTIPEAVELVLQAAALGTGGETFVLDMGDPVRIADLAKDLIKLSGLEVGKDIDLIYTGLRPGEKLSEELFNGGEQVVRVRLIDVALLIGSGRSSRNLREQFEREIRLLTVEFT